MSHRHNGTAGKLPAFLRNHSTVRQGERWPPAPPTSPVHPPHRKHDGLEHHRHQDAGGALAAHHAHGARADAPKELGALSAHHAAYPHGHGNATRHHNAATAASSAVASSVPSLSVMVPFSLGLFSMLMIEDSLLRPLERVTVKHAACWLLGFAVYCGVFGVFLGEIQGWADSGTYFFCLGLNVVLSPDNLVVFMMFLQQAALPVRFHFRAISHGMLLAVKLRTVAMLGGAALLNRFTWLQFVLAALILASGFRLLCFPEPSSSESDVQAASDHWAVRQLARVFPLVWSDDSEDAYFARDDKGRLCVTRMAAVVVAIGFTDLTFAMDSISAVLGSTTDTTLIITSQALSMLLLRPIYFMFSAALAYFDAVNSVLALILITIGAKIFLGAADIQVPMWLFVGVLTVWRVGMALMALRAAYRVAKVPCDEGAAGHAALDDVAEADSKAPLKAMRRS